MLFLLSALFYPSELPEPWDADEHFLEIRRWFFGIEIAWILLEFTDTHLKDHFDDFSATYFFLMGGWLLFAVWGWISANKKTQAFIAIYHLVTVVAWITYQLWDLEWKGAAGG